MIPLQPPQLDYGKPTPVHHRKGFHRAAIVGALVIVSIVVWQQGPAWWREIRATYYGRQCRSYVAPANQIACTVDLATGRVGTNAAPDCWFKFCATSRMSSFSLPQNQGVALLFLHERATPNGEKHLIALVLGGYSYIYLQFATGLSAASSSSVYETPARIKHLDKGLLRLYAGQPDSADPSHFTMGYDVDGKPGTIDGWLENDRSIKMEFRDGPLRP